MSGAGAALHSAALLQEHLPETRERIRHEVGLLVFRREENEIGQAVDYHGSDFPDIGIAALEALLHELVDVAVQAIGHRAPVFIRRSTVVHLHEGRPQGRPRALETLRERSLSSSKDRERFSVWGGGR